MALGYTYDIIVKHINTEKSSRDLANDKYYFEVHRDATKNDVKSAVEKIFAVKVVKVNVNNRLGKVKGFRGRKGQRKSKRIAIVTLEKGQKINFDKIG